MRLAERVAQSVLGASTLFGTYSSGWLLSAACGYAITGKHSMLALCAGNGVEFALINGPVKALFKRERPPPDAALISRPSWLPTPRTTSFPSGHASAAAFNCIVWLHYSPITGLAAGVVAAGICGSRVIFGYHHWTDVLGGLVTGTIFATVALAKGWLG